MAFSARNSVQPFCESNSRPRTATLVTKDDGDGGGKQERRRNSGDGEEGRDKIERGPLRFLFTVVPNEPKETTERRGRWGQRWRVINGRDSIWGQSTFLSSPLARPLLVLSVCLPFRRRSRLSFAFSRAFATCVEHELCLARSGARARSSIFLLFYDP